MSFDNPSVLCFLLLPVLFIPFIVMRYRKSRSRAAVFAAAAPSGERQSLLAELRLRMIVSDFFFLLFTCFLIIAMAGPRWGTRIVPDYRRGVDLVLAFDLSRSMNVSDSVGVRDSIGIHDSVGVRDSIGIHDPMEQTRLERGLEIAGELAAVLGDIRLGAAIGKGRGILAVPLTYDSETILSFLYGLDDNSISGTGTNLESLINAASGAFQSSVQSHRAIILFSDGEAHSGSFQGAVDRARRNGISVSAVGLGSDRGGPVPVERGPDAPDGFLLDADGNTVISARQANALRQAAERTGGIYVDGSRNDAARMLSSFINSVSADSRMSGQRHEANPRWQIFVFSAMACLAGARIMGFRKKKSGSAVSGKNISIIFLFFCITLFSSCEGAQGRLAVMEGNFFYTRGYYTEAISSYLNALNHEAAVPYAEFGLASAFFALDESSAAITRYDAAEETLPGLKQGNHQELRYRINYNRGIIYFEQGEYEQAALAFREALKIDGSRIEAKRNLELSLLTVARQNSPDSASSRTHTESGQQGTGGNSSVIFEYLREMEQEQWKSREWTGESEITGPDY